MIKHISYDMQKMLSEDEYIISIGIDQSFTGTGVVGLKYYPRVNGAVKIFETLISTKKETSGKNPLDYHRRSAEIANEVVSIIKTNFPNHPDYISMEGMSYGSTKSIIFDLGGLFNLISDRVISTFLKPNLIKVSKDFFIIQPKTVKKLFTGNGNAKKEDMIQKALDLGYSFEHINKNGVPNDNIVDATAIALTPILKNEKVKSYRSL